MRRLPYDFVCAAISTHPVLCRLNLLHGDLIKPSSRVFVVPVMRKHMVTYAHADDISDCSVNASCSEAERQA